MSSINKKDEHHSAVWSDVNSPAFFERTRKMTSDERSAYISELTRSVLKGMGFDEDAHNAAMERFKQLDDWNPSSGTSGS